MILFLSIIFFVDLIGASTRQTWNIEHTQIRKWLPNKTRKWCIAIEGGFICQQKKDTLNEICDITTKFEKTGLKQLEFMSKGNKKQMLTFDSKEDREAFLYAQELQKLHLAIKSAFVHITLVKKRHEGEPEIKQSPYYFDFKGEMVEAYYPMYQSCRDVSVVAKKIIENPKSDLSLLLKSKPELCQISKCESEHSRSQTVTFGEKISPVHWFLHNKKGIIDFQSAILENNSLAVGSPHTKLVDGRIDYYCTNPIYFTQLFNGRLMGAMHAIINQGKKDCVLRWIPYKGRYRKYILNPKYNIDNQKATEYGLKEPEPYLKRRNAIYELTLGMLKRFNDPNPDYSDSCFTIGGMKMSIRDLAGC